MKLLARWSWLVAVVGFALLVIVLRSGASAGATNAGVRLVLWHSQRGAEKDALEALLRRFNQEHEGKIAIEPLAVPDSSFKDKVLRTIPRGAGPDLFIRPHNELGELARAEVVRPIAGPLPFAEKDYLPGLLDGVSRDGARLGAPLTFKGLLLFYKKSAFPEGPPASFEAIEKKRASLPDDSFPFAYDATSLFFHAPFFLAEGGRVFEEGSERFAAFAPTSLDAWRLPGSWKEARILPPEPSYNEAIRLFERGQAAAIFCGNWYTPQGDIAAAKDWDIAPLPTFRGTPMGSFITVETLFVSRSSAHPVEAEEALRFLAGAPGEEARQRELSLPPVERGAYAASHGDPFAAKLAGILRATLEHGTVTPSSTKMAAVWRPAEDVLRASIARRDVDDAVTTARAGLSAVEDKRPQAHGVALPGVLLVALLTLASVLLVRQVRADGVAADAARARLLGAWGKSALAYLLPGVTATLVLVLVPVAAAAGLSFFEYDAGRFVFVGVDNFREILLPPLERAFVARSFYFALGVTVLWTVLNVVLHVTLGIACALLLRPTWIRMRTGFRILLVLPWAIPNYITALMWKGMFHAQVGAINKLLAPFGFEGYAWFDHFSTAFFANLVTNTWLGFPFMMVVTLGALSSLPKELEEAAELDGASRWQRFSLIVWPHVRPALAPSVILGSVWTFNMFNVVYLVSAGEPGSQTDILVSEAYRWAFERGERYGFAAAYSVLIFAFLLFYGRVTRRVVKEEA